MNNAVLLRELRRLLPSKACWGIAVASGLLMRDRAADSGAGVGIWLAVVAACMSLYWAHRSMQAELEEETIEHLGTLPIAPLAIVFQIGLASAASALLFSLVTLLIAWPSPIDQALNMWLRGAGGAFALAWMGAMGAFRFGDTFLGGLGAMGPMAFLLGSAFALEVCVLAYLDTPLALAGSLCVGAGASLMCYYAWLLMGGQWVESIIPRPDARRTQSRAPGEPPEPITPSPDWSSPVFWYELCANRLRLSLAIGLPGALMLALGICGYVTSALQSVLLSCSVSLGTLAVTLMTASRAAQHGRTGLWTDLAVTPVSARRVVLAQLAGMLTRCALIFVSWMACAWIAAGFELTSDLGSFLLFVAGLWIVAAVCGYLAGAWTSGWKAGLLAVFLVYITMCLVPFANWLMWWLFDVPRFGSGCEFLALPLMGLWTVFLFYGCVRRVESFQA